MNLKHCFCAAALVFCAVVGSPAMAHKVNLFAYAEGDEVYVEGYFVDGKKAQNSKIEVYSPAGELLLEGITDEQGQYRFPVPQRTDLKIVVNAGMGHKSEFLLSAAELGGAAPASPARDEADADAAVAAVAAPAGAGDQAALEAVVREAVNEAIKPLVRSLAESQQKASFTGIVGGVGYILGLLGLFAWFKARQISRTP